MSTEVIEKEISLTDEELKSLVAETAKAVLGTQKEEKKEEKKEDIKTQVETMVKDTLSKLVEPSKMQFGAKQIKERGDGKRSFAEVLKGIKTNNQYLIKKYDMAMVDEDQKVLVEGNNALGGFLVPPEYSTKLIDNIMLYSVIRPLCTVMPMQGVQLNMPVVTNGGTAYWIDENGQKTETNLTFSQLTLTAYKLCMLTKVSDELLADSNPAVDTILLNMFAKTIANEEDRAFIAGTGGAGDPIIGILNVAGVNIVPAGAGLDFDDIFRATGLAEQNGATDISIVHAPRDKRTLRILKGADGQYLWASATSGAPATIDGYNTYKDGNIPTNLGVGLNESVLIAGDFSNCYIGDREGIVISVGLDGNDFSFDRTSFRAVKRVGFRIAAPDRLSVVTGILPTP